jgi:hypothetical protein
VRQIEFNYKAYVVQGNQLKLLKTINTRPRQKWNLLEFFLIVDIKIVFLMLKYRKTATRVYFLIKQFKKKSLHFFMHGVITFIAFVYVNFPLVQKYLVFYTRVA